MTLAFDDIPEVDSCLRRLDPRWKLAAGALAAAVITALRTWPAAAAALAGAVFLVALGRLPLGWYRKRLAAVALMAAPFVVLLPWLYRGPGPAWSLGFLRVSADGVRLALLVACKALALGTLVLVVLATAPPAETLKAAHALRVPGVVVQLLALSYRYVFVLADEFHRLRTALRVRGFRNRASLASYRTVGHVAGTLLVRGAERADRVGQAMRCRGFTGRFRTLTDFHTRPADVLAGAAVAAALLALWLWDSGGSAAPWPSP
jgi:cobalt/nickel transport system permease protein